MRDDTTKGIQRHRARGPLGVILRVTNRPTKPRLLRLGEGTCICGAGRDADLVIVDETVSRRHVELSLVPEGVAVKDLSSHNGTWYLGQRIQTGVVAIGSTLHIGRAELRIEPDEEALNRGVSTSFETYGRLIGRSASMRKLFGLLTRIESSLVNVLVEGESGTGKELIARAIHERSSVADGPFVALNCGAIERALVRSELFGHKRGAFTGALENRTGAFEAASGGTLFLDELGELPLDVQPVFLRALESGAITRVGEHTERPVKVRIVSATNRDLSAEVRAGRFREDLYFRLVVVHLTVPPLRARPEDIAPLAAQFAEGLGIQELSTELVQQLEARSWSGNARELRNVIQAYSVLGTLPPAASAREAEVDEMIRRIVDPDKPYLEQKERLTKRFLRVYLELVLARAAGNKSLAARISGLDRAYLSKIVTQLQQGEPLDRGDDAADAPV